MLFVADAGASSAGGASGWSARWYLTPKGDGYYEIFNGYSGLCLDNKDFATAPGSPVQQWTCNGLAVQQWDLA